MSRSDASSTEEKQYLRVLLKRYPPRTVLDRVEKEKKKERKKERRKEGRKERKEERKKLKKEEETEQNKLQLEKHRTRCFGGLSRGNSRGAKTRGGGEI